MTSRRTALPSTSTAGSIAALQLRSAATALDMRLSAATLALASQVVDGAVSLGADKLELRYTIDEYVRVELSDTGLGLDRFLQAEAPDALARLDTLAQNWGHDAATVDSPTRLRFDLPLSPLEGCSAISAGKKERSA